MEKPEVGSAKCYLPENTAINFFTAKACGFAAVRSCNRVIEAEAKAAQEKTGVARAEFNIACLGRDPETGCGGQIVGRLYDESDNVVRDVDISVKEAAEKYPVALTMLHSKAAANENLTAESRHPLYPV
jgi:hypothetical protein